MSPFARKQKNTNSLDIWNDGLSERHSIISMTFNGPYSHSLSLFLYSIWCVHGLTMSEINRQRGGDTACLHVSQRFSSFVASNAFGGIQ